MNDSADILASGSGVGGFGLQRPGVLVRLHRDFVASPGEVVVG
jgi:hypothetical protein